MSFEVEEKCGFAVIGAKLDYVELRVCGWSYGLVLWALITSYDSVHQTSIGTYFLVT